MPVVDFHNHVYPPAYVEAVRAGPSAYTVTADTDGNPVLHSPGDYNVLVPGHRLIDVRLRALDLAGVDRQVVSFTAPGTLIETPERSAALCRLVNDAFAQIQRDHPDRFACLATLPLNDPAAAVAELRRALGPLGLRGATLFSNANGVAVWDRRFEPLYAEADALGAVLFIHPTFPLGVEAMQEYMLMPLVGFPADTSLAAAGLVFSGVVERFPRIRWVLGHLGGAIPYLAERLDRGFEAYSVCRQRIARPPSEYLRRFFYDTVNFDVRALRLAVEFAGPAQLVAGSDYPHQIGSLEKMRSSIEALGLAPADREAVLGGNALRLLGW